MLRRHLVLKHTSFNLKISQYFVPRTRIITKLLGPLTAKIHASDVSTSDYRLGRPLFIKPTITRHFGKMIAANTDPLNAPLPSQKLEFKPRIHIEAGAATLFATPSEARESPHSAALALAIALSLGRNGFQIQKQVLRHPPHLQ